MSEEEFLVPPPGPSPFGVIWGGPGQKTFFIGTDRGMLYPESGPGVAWNGLVSVEETPTNGQLRPIYIDGIRRRHHHFLEEFAATITAFTAPKEFGPCEGERELVPGLYLGQQIREPFGFSYRSFIGNDFEILGKAYEIHIVYGCMTEPSSRTYTSISNEISAETRSWEVATLPEDVFDHKPSARLRLDSREIDPDKLLEIEYILYGTLEEPPRQPSIEEIREILIAIPEEEQEEIPWEETDTEDTVEVEG